MKPTLASLFPYASKSCEDVNPLLSLSPTGCGKLQGNVGRKRGIPNKTEAEFALRLEAMKRNGEILRYEYEGITLRWSGMRYTPDFLVLRDPICAVNRNRALGECSLSPCVTMIEVKGGHIWDRDIVRFKGARAHWPEFAFEMWQKQKTGWKRIH